MDGLVWEMGDCSMKHIAAFPALGYVQVSFLAGFDQQIRDPDIAPPLHNEQPLIPAKVSSGRAKCCKSFLLSHAFSLLICCKASKQQRKFLAAPHNSSYSAICDASRHVYIYRYEYNTYYNY